MSTGVPASGVFEISAPPDEDEDDFVMLSKFLNINVVVNERKIKPLWVESCLKMNQKLFF